MVITKEPLASCGEHTLAEAEASVIWDGLCPIHLSAQRDELADERNGLLDENEALRFQAISAQQGYDTLLERVGLLEEELAARKA